MTDNNSEDLGSPVPSAFSQQIIDGVTIPKGIIIPPPEVRSIVEKTAGYVVRNGRGFEARVREKEQSNSKFNFIKFEDPYFAYYSWRLEELEAGGQGIGTGDKTSSSSPVPSSSNSATGPSISTSSNSEKPDPLEFIINLPPISAQDYDIIKITALYVARNGSQFQTALQHSEARNYQYDFLKPTHSLFPLFSNLVEQYKKVINPPSVLLDKLQQISKDPYSVINNARVRAEWTARQESETQKAAEKAEKDRIEYAQIDWHDFVVVETIRFTEADERANLPAPLSKAQLEYASLEQKKMSSLRIEEAPPDFDEGLENETQARPMAAPISSRTPSSLPQPPRHNHSESPEPDLDEHKSSSESPSDLPARVSHQFQYGKQLPSTQGSPLPAGMKIKSAGTSRRGKFKTSTGISAGEPMVESPLTGERIPQSQLEEHMRITLLDPKWKEQKAISEARQATTNLSTSEVSANIKRLASHLHQNEMEDQDENGTRTNSGDGREQSNEKQDGPPRKKVAVQWDGYSSSKDRVRQQAATQTSLNEQREAKRREMERLNKIGATPKPT